jgi:Fe-S-cluster containining protein
VNGSGGNLAGCATCAGRCCREYRVEVVVRDVRILAEGTALHPREFLWLRDSGGANGFQMQPGGNGMELHLRRHQPTGACVFLMEMAPDIARCGVYAHRPMVCRNFPATLERGAVSVRSGTKCGPDAWNLATMDLCTYRKDLVLAKAAWAEHWQLLRAWNARITDESRTATEDELYDYVLNAVPEPV